MAKQDPSNLSKRERQIMDILHQIGEGSVNDVIDKMINPSSYNSIRKLMNILEDKGVLEHRQDKNRYIYFPTLKKEVAKKSALKHLITTYFEKSVPNVVSTLLSDSKLSKEELDEISALIDKAKKQGGHHD